MAAYTEIGRRNPVVFILTLSLYAFLLGYWIIASIHGPQTGWDFPVFYIAGHVPLRSLYDPDVFLNYWRVHLQTQGVIHWAPYVRLPIFALPLRFLLHLPYSQAFGLWIVLNATAYLTAITLLLRKLGVWWMIALALLSYFPAFVGTVSGADACLYLLAVVIVFVLLESKRQWLVGFGLTVCLYKYNLIFLVPVMLLIQRRYRALTGLLIGSLVLTASTLALVPVSAYIQILQTAPALARGFYPVGLRGFMNCIQMPELYPVLAAVVVLLCCWLFTRLDATDAMAAAITGTLMVSPYVNWYDSTLLVIPILVIFSRSEAAIRAACVVLVLAVPLWARGGGNNGPTGFVHVAVETAIMTWLFLRAFGVTSFAALDGRRDPLLEGA